MKLYNLLFLETNSTNNTTLTVPAEEKTKAAVLNLLDNNPKLSDALNNFINQNNPNTLEENTLLQSLQKIPWQKILPILQDIAQELQSGSIEDVLQKYAAKIVASGFLKYGKLIDAIRKQRKAAKKKFLQGQRR